MVRSLVGVLRVLPLSTLLLGCSSASWQTLNVDPGYRPPKILSVAVAASRQWPDAVNELESDLVDELNARGVSATLLWDSKTRADASLRIVKWDPGSRTLRCLIGWGTGEAEIIVELRSSGINGTARGLLWSGTFGGKSKGAVAEAAYLIAATIATGHAPEPPPEARRPYGANGSGPATSCCTRSPPNAKKNLRSAHLEPSPLCGLLVETETGWA
jgi:Domain of unknown function (DUF4410)